MRHVNRGQQPFETKDYSQDKEIDIKIMKFTKKAIFKTAPKTIPK